MITLGELHGVSRNCISNVGINSKSGMRRQSGHCHLDSLCFGQILCYISWSRVFLSVRGSQPSLEFCDSRVVAALYCWLMYISYTHRNTKYNKQIRLVFCKFKRHELFIQFNGQNVSVGVGVGPDL